MQFVKLLGKIGVPFVVLGFLLSAGCGGGGGGGGATGSNSIPDTVNASVAALQLVWADEFNTGTQPDPANWELLTGYGPNNDGWGNDESQLYTATTSNVKIENGNLVITARCDTGVCGKRDGTITSSRIRTKDKFEFRYGRVEARIKVPAGKSTWPAFWMLGANFPETAWPGSGEIDILEVHQQNSTINHTHSALHWDDNGHKFSTQSRRMEAPLSDDYHIWTLDWDEERIVFKIDQIPYYTVVINPETQREFLRSFFLIFNIAIDGNLGAPPDAIKTTPQEMLVDWVRVYQRPANQKVSLGENQAGAGALSIQEVITSNNVGGAPVEVNLNSTEVPPLDGQKVVAVNFGAPQGSISRIGSVRKSQSIVPDGGYKSGFAFRFASADLSCNAALSVGVNNSSLPSFDNLTIQLMDSRNSGEITSTVGSATLQIKNYFSSEPETNWKLYNLPLSNFSAVNYNPSWGQATSYAASRVASNNVIQMSKLNYQGIDFSSIKQNLTNYASVHFDYWTTDISTFKFFLISTGGATAEFAYDVTTTAKGNWQGVDVPLTSFTGVDMANVAQIKIDAQADVDGGTLFLDNIYFYNNSSTLSEPENNPNNPRENASDVISIFSDSYTDVTSVNLNPNWGQNTVYSAVSLSGNKLIKYANLNYQGIDFSGNVQNVSSRNTLHLDYWTSTATAFRVYLISVNGAELGFQVNPNRSGWQSLNIPLSYFSGTVDLVQIMQMKFDDASTGEAATIFLDNIYFYSSTGTNTKPVDAPVAPTRLSTNVISLFSDSYNDIGGVERDDITRIGFWNPVDANGSAVSGKLFLDALSLSAVDEPCFGGDGGSGSGDGKVVNGIGLPVDFERTDANYAITSFEGGTATVIDNPQTTGNSSAKVMQMIKNGGQTYGGAKLAIDRAADFSSNQLFSINVWSARAVPVLLKLEGSSSNVELTAYHTGGSVWQTLYFNFSGRTASLGSVNALTFIFDNGVVGDYANSASDWRFFVDDIKLVPNNTFVAVAPADAPTTPTTNPVISIFSDAYTNITSANFNPDWGQATTYSAQTLAGNNVIRLANLNYQGIDFSGNKQNVSGYGSVHFDYWTTDISTFGFYLISIDGTTIESSYTVSSSTTGSWQGVDVPLSAFAGVVLTQVAQIKIDAQADTDSGTLFLDNIYFHGASSGSNTGSGSSTGITPQHVLYATTASVDTPFPANGIADFGSGAIFNAAHTGDSTYNPVFSVTSGEGYGAGVHVAFLAVQNYSAGFANNYNTFVAKVKNSPDGRIEVKFIGGGDDSVVTIDTANYSGATALTDGWIQIAIPYSEFTNSANIANHTGWLLGPPGDQADSTFVFLFTDVGFSTMNAGGGSNAASAPSDAPTAPTSSPVISIFSDAYTDITSVEFNPNWGQATTYSAQSIAGNNVIRYANLNYQGIDFSTNKQNVTSFSSVHFDYWTTDISTFQFFLISIDGTTIESSYTVASPVAGSWQGVDVPLSSFGNVVMTQVAQIKIDAQADTNGGTLFLDNIYFHGTPYSGIIPSHVLYATSATVDTSFPANGFSDFGSGASFNANHTSDSKYNPVFSVTSGEGYGAGVHVAFVAVQNYTAGFAANYSSFVAKVKGSPDNRIEVKLIGGVADSVATVNVISYSGSRSLGDGWYQLEIPFSEFTNSGNIANHTGWLLGPPGDQADSTFVFLFTDVGFNGSAPTAPINAPTAPTKSPTISIFSDAYTAITSLTLNPDWGQATVNTTQNIANNNVMRLQNLNYQGIDFSANKQNVATMTSVHFDYWTTDISTFQFFLISVDGSTIESSYTVSSTTSGSWQGVDVPLSSFGSVLLTRVAQIKIDAQADANSGTLFLDNIYFSDPAGVATEPSDAPTAPTTSPVISIFSDAYTPITSLTLNPDWGQATTNTTTSLANNNVMKLANLNYQGIDFSTNKQNLTTFTTVHFDYWTQDISTFQFYLISIDATTVETAHTISSTSTGSWQSIAVPLSSFSVIDLSKVSQIKIDAQADTSSGTLFLDNIYFHK